MPRRSNTPWPSGCSRKNPSRTAYADLERDGTTTWSGVTNALAQKHLRAIKKGDRIFFYHTGDEKAVVGVMEATADASPDPDDDGGQARGGDREAGAEAEEPGDARGDQGGQGVRGVGTGARSARLSVMPVPAASVEEDREVGGSELSARRSARTRHARARGPLAEKVNPRVDTPGGSICG